MTAKKKKIESKVEKNFSLKINKVKIDEINFKEPSDDFIENFKEDLLDIRLTLKFTYDFAKDFLSVTVHIWYDYNDNNDIDGESKGKTILLDFTGTLDFTVGNFSDVVEKKETGVVVPNILLEMVTSIAVSSARGIIIAKTAGTFINKYYLPLVNIQDIIKTLGPMEDLSSS